MLHRLLRYLGIVLQSSSRRCTLFSWPLRYILSSLARTVLATFTLLTAPCSGDLFLRRSGTLCCARLALHWFCSAPSRLLCTCSASCSSSRVRLFFTAEWNQPSLVKRLASPHWLLYGVMNRRERSISRTAGLVNFEELCKRANLALFWLSRNISLYSSPSL